VRKEYPSIPFFQKQGFRVLPSTWNNPDAAVAMIRSSRKDATEKMLGILFTGWSAGGNGEHLLTELRPDAPSSPGAATNKTAKQVAATIRAGLKELGVPAGR